MEKKELKNGDILHCTSKTFKSKLIGLLIGSKTTNSAIYTVINNFGVVADVDKNNIVRLTRFEKWRKDFDFVCSGANVESAVGFAQSMISCKGHNFESEFSLLKKSVKNNVLELDLIKEEIVLAVFGRMEITPAELYEYCLNLDLTI